MTPEEMKLILANCKIRARAFADERGEKPTPLAFFQVDDAPPEYWCWAIYYLRKTGEPEWIVNPIRPNHFRSHDRAMEQVNDLHEVDPETEYRVMQKYMGYIPDEDETWLI